MWIEPHQLPIGVAIPIARARSSRLDVTQHGAGIATDRVVSHAGLRSACELLSRESLSARGREWQESFSVELQWHHAGHSGLPEQSG